MSAVQEFFRRDRVFDFMVPKVVDGLDLSHGTVLYMEDVSVAFDGFKAINNLNFYVNAGELRCLIGPNGAGKTTMMDIITGKTRPDTGTCWFGSRMNLLQMSEPEIARAGIGRKFQKPTVFECHSVFENLELSMAGPKGVWRTLRARLAPHERARIDEVLELIGLAARRDTPAGILTYAEQRALEIGITIAGGADVIMLDEPTAGMSNTETEQAVELIRKVSEGRTLMMVEHDMSVVFGLADRISVLVYGEIIATGAPAEIRANKAVREAYLGEEAH